jgi:hypothetical protein
MLPDGTRGKRARWQRRAIISAGRYIPNAAWQAEQEQRIKNNPDSGDLPF